MAEPQNADNYEEVFDDDGPPPKEAASVHRIRANSTIMQLKKILGELALDRGLLEPDLDWSGLAAKLNCAAS